MESVFNVVFDVGRVLIDFSYDDFFTLLRRRGARIVDEEDFATQVGLTCYEHGQMSNTEFLARLNALLENPLPENYLIAAWNSLFTPINEMLSLAEQLKKLCGVYLLSNTSELHWQQLLETFELDDICHDRLASYEVGAMKPSAEIFLAAEQRFGLQPETTVFVDDKQLNVIGAVTCGWQGIRHRNSATTISQLRAVTGIDV